jgi:hypothetical protein
MAIDIRQRAAVAHRKQVEFTIADIADFLQETLGRQLVAYIAGAKDATTVAQWIKGQAPRPEAEARLRAAFQVFHLLQDEESPHTVRAWFIGMNPQLDDVSPAEALHDGQMKDVLVAAKAYIAGG